MKDLKISIAILLILAVLFSVYGTPPEQDSAPPPKMETHGEGTQEQDESSYVLPGNDDLQYAESPKTGDWLLEIFG